jgi:antitoxin VapB
LAYGDLQTDLQITRVGDVITIFPSRGSLKDVVAELRALPPLPIEEHEPIEMPDREEN